MNRFLRSLFHRLRPGDHTPSSPQCAQSTVLTPEVTALLRLEDPAKLCIQVHHHLFQKYSESDIPTALTPAERIVFLINIFLGDVENGGFEQFFSNSAGNYAAEVLSACQTIGAVPAAKLLKKAIAQFPRKYVPTDWEARLSLMDNLPESSYDTWSELDNLFYAGAGDDLEISLANYIRAYASSFC